MRTDWLKTIFAAGLILAAGAWVSVSAAEMEQEEQIMAELPVHQAQMRTGRFELGPEQIEMILNRVRQEDPQRAQELQHLQETNPDAFKMEIRKLAREQFTARRGEQDRQGFRRPGPEQGEWRERMRERFQEGSEEFMTWLKGNYPDEAAKLERLKEENPDQFMRAMGLMWRKYGPIFHASKDNPALAAVLKDQLTLRERRGELLRQIKVTTDEKQKEALVKELEGIVSQQFDLIVRRKELAYEDLNKKLEELKKEIEQRKAEVEKWKSKDFKNEQVKQRVNELVSETEKFEWE